MKNIKYTQEIIMRKLTRLKTGTNTLFQRTDDDYELISEQISKVEIDLHNIQNNKNSSNVATTHTPQRHPLLDRDDGNINGNISSNFATPQHTTSTHQ